MKDDLQIPEAMLNRISAAIKSDTSPVGIDAVKAHVVIIYKLLEIERRLDDLDSRIPAGRNR